MEHSTGIPRISSVEPVFAVVAGHRVCTRTWEGGADPKLSHGEVVQLGKTVCQVIEKVTHSTKAGIYLITYKFSPVDRHSFEEQHAALEQDPFNGTVFLNLPIPSVGQIVDVAPNKPSNNFENVIGSIR